MDSSTYGTLTTVGGWVAVLGVAGAFYWHHKNNTKGRKRNLVPKQSWKQAADIDVDETSSTKKKSEKASKPKPKPKPVSKPTSEATSTAVNYTAANAAAESRDQDREFARQFSNVQAGTNFASAKKEETRTKSVKQSRAQEKDQAPTEKVSAPSSTTGDADDDLSPAGSPPVQAADSRDVSDMLEKAAAGPSVLRLTDTDKQKPTQKKTKAPEVVESKKQRQNRKKAEAAKAEREEAEKERKTLMEQQRRTARIAEGRAAKDGSTFTNQQQTAWKANTNGHSDHGTVQPLDTFEAKPAPSQPGNTTRSTPPATKERSDSWLSDLPSEEEQLERLKVQQLEDSWNEVRSKKTKGKKKDVPGGDAVETTPKEKTVVPTSSANTIKSRAPLNGNTQKKPALASNSSFAALTPADDDEVEEEWDV